MNMTLTTYNLLDFSVAEKEQLKQHVFAQLTVAITVSLFCDYSYFKINLPNVDWTNIPSRTTHVKTLN